MVAAPAGLRLRVGPGLSEPIIFVLAHGETVTPGGAPTWNDGLSWTFVRVYRWGRWYEGFCASRYLGTASGAQGSLRVVAPAGLNLRWGPGTGYGVARCLPYGTLVRPTGIYQWGDGVRWTQVQYGGHYYWAAASWLRSA